MPLDAAIPEAGSDNLVALPNDKTVIRSHSSSPRIQPPLAVSPANIGQSLVGNRLEHYELVEFVGGGGMGAVFRAIDTRLGRTVAVKVLSRDSTDEETIRRFQNEAQSAARLDHPNIARVYYVGEDHGWNFIVFEFIEGVNLRDIVDRSGPLPLGDALYYTLQSGRGPGSLVEPRRGTSRHQALQRAGHARRPRSSSSIWGWPGCTRSNRRPTI